MSDEILDIEVEETTSWIKQVEQMSKEGKKVVIRELLEYRDSDNFKEVLAYCKSQIAVINAEIYTEAYNREKCEATSSILDSYVVTARATRDIADKVDNELFKQYLVQSRISALDSAILFKIWDPYGVPFDLPIHSSLDIKKTRASAYNSFETFLANCISHYDEKEIVAKMDEEAKEKKNKKEVEEDDNPNQPY
jgi:hypothetical protein